jgi:hypothetical protein
MTMAAPLTLHREVMVDETTGYKVVDHKENTVGFLVAKEKKNKRAWGFVFVSGELERKPNIYRYDNKKEALEALVFARFTKTSTGPIKIVK